MPAATARSASSARSTPFSSSFRGQRSRKRLRSSQRKDGSNMPWPTKALTSRPGCKLALDVDEARPAGRDGCDPARMHQHVEPGRQREPAVAASRPVRKSRSRLPATGKSLVSIRRLETGVKRAPDQPFGDAPLGEHVGLQPQPARRLARDVLDQAHRNRGHRERHARRRRRPRERQVAVPPGQAVQAGRTDDDGQRGGAPSSCVETSRTERRRACAAGNAAAQRPRSCRAA